MTDKSKRPSKKRHVSFHQHQPTNRVNKFLAQTIEARSMGQEKSNHVHALTLCFRDSLKLGTSKSIDPSSLFYYFQTKRWPRRWASSGAAASAIVITQQTHSPEESFRRQRFLRQSPPHSRSGTYPMKTSWLNRTWSFWLYLFFVDGWV